MPPEDVEIQFPLRGLNEGWAYGKQPPLTTPDAQNVLPIDPIASRIRGGQRPGLSKYYATQHNGSNPLQRINCIVSSITGKSNTETFTQANGILLDTRWWTSEITYPNVTASATYPIVSGNKIVHDNTTDPGNNAWVAAFHKEAQIESDTFEIQADVTLVTATDKLVYVGLITRCITPSFPFTTGGFMSSGIQMRDYSGTPKIEVYAGDVGQGLHTMTPGSGDWLDPAYWTTARTLKVVTVGGLISVYADDVLLEPAYQRGALSSYPGKYVGFDARKSDHADTAITLDNWAFNQVAVTAGRAHKLIFVSGGDIYAATPKGFPIIATSGTNAVALTGRVDVQGAYNKVYFADGDPRHYKVLDIPTNIVEWWRPTTGTIPLGSDETYYDLTAVDQGNKKFTIAENESRLVAGDYIQIAGSSDNDGYYTVASVAGTGPTAITINEAIPDATVDGTLRYVPYGCKIVKLYRGRIVMAGLHNDPHNWFMSAMNDPFDWDYAPATTTAKMAVAGNNTDAGKVGDIVTCLAPYSDDLMFLGGDHTLWVMRGDPADRGRIDNVSYQTGIAGPDAYSFDPNGTFYFFGSGQVWRMSSNPGAVPESISGGRLDATFRAIDLKLYSMQLHWSNDLQGLFIFVVPNTSGATTHYFWDQRTDSFWKVVFPNDMIATAYPFDGDDPDDSYLLLGGWDGYIRAVDRDAKDDDGTAISSHVVFSPINLGGMRRNTKLTRLELLLDEDSDDATVSIYAGESVQKALDLGKLIYSRSVSAGKNDIINRAMGNTLILRLANTVLAKQWAMEAGSVRVALAGQTRKGSL